MTALPPCPKCSSAYTYEDGGLLICPECAHEWSASDTGEDEAKIVRDAHGTVLKDGDSVTVIKDLKIKGTSSVVKIGTKIKNIRVVGAAGSDGHDIDCNVPGHGPMGLKSEFIKKIVD